MKAFVGKCCKDNFAQAGIPESVIVLVISEYVVLGSEYNGILGMRRKSPRPVERHKAPGFS